jgi:hypothetical protein
MSANYLGGQMRIVLAAALLLGLAACENRADRETGRVGESADTNVMTRTTQDTMIVTSDTSIDTDTTVREGDVKRDTAGRDTAITR